jgi:DNA-binding HxlR family transcriptional regulator
MESAMRWSEIDRIPCPVAQTMSVIGDAWTTLILRDAILRGAKRFDEFQASTRASRAILSDRLSHLVECGVFKRVRYEAHPPRYEYRLTPRGEALKPVLMMLADWAEDHLPAKVHRWGRRHTECGHRFRSVIACSECGEAIKPGTVTYDNPPVLKREHA